MVMGLIQQLPNIRTVDMTGGNCVKYLAFFDNYFTSIPLLTKLKLDYNILATGTIRPNRSGYPSELKSAVAELKNNPGVFKSMTLGSDVLATLWISTKPVHFVSSIPGGGSKGNVQIKRERMMCPTIAKLYRENMDAVDRNDQFLSSYRIFRKFPPLFRKIYPLIMLCLNFALFFVFVNFPGLRKSSKNT